MMLRKGFILGALALIGALVMSIASAQEPTISLENGYPQVSLDHPYAAFLQTADFAQSKGATREWRKLEWTAVDKVNNKIYFAVSRVGAGMADTEGDIQLPKNDCGMVMVGDLDADFNVTELKPLIIGGPFTDNEDTSLQCADDNISEPDNLFVDAVGNLWIGEDTNRHVNQYLWRWDGTELKRFASMPMGAEVTGLKVSDQGTVFLNVQHPDAMNAYPFNQGTVGVVTGFNASEDFTSLVTPEGAAMNTVTLAVGEYQVIARGSDAFPSNVENTAVGEITDATTGALMFVCNDPDANMFLPTVEDGTEGYLYTNWECLPGGVSKLYIKQNAQGMWDSVQGNMVDFTSVRGTYFNCGASVTPWNTALTSEEYPADTEEDYLEELVPYANMLQAAAGIESINVFDYGYAVEIIPGSFGEDEIIKHYAMGRRSLENALVMNDGKTVYFGDDGTNRVMSKFVASEAGSLDAGTLYAAKVTQTGDATTADFTFQLEWIELGTATNAEIETAIRALDAATAEAIQTAVGG